MATRAYEDGEVWKSVVAGAVAGTAATFVMNQFQSLVKHLAPPQGESSAQKSGGKKKQQKEEDDATVKTAARISEGVFHHKLTQKEKKVAGPLVHYAFGATMGAVYGGLAQAAPALSSGVGLPFGAALWLTADEVAVPAAGLAKKPTEVPPSKHASELGAHLVYGLATDLGRRLLLKLG